ncbi:MAG: hypothetical protein ACLR0U_16440 [Enterocloster clostridioformis]
MVQLQAAFNQMLETVVNHTPDSELTNQEQPEPPLEPDSTFTAAAATDVRPEQMTAAKAGDRRMPDYAELKAESSLHTMKSRAFLPDREAEASERDSELSQAGFARSGQRNATCNPARGTFWAPGSSRLAETILQRENPFGYTGPGRQKP